MTETVNGAWRAVDGKFYELPSRHFHADGREELSTEMRDQLVDRVTRLLPQVKRNTTLALMAIVALRRTIDELEHEVIASARADHWSWRDIGSVLGRSVSAVHERFARTNVRPRQRRR